MWAKVSFRRFLCQLILTCALGCTFLGYLGYFALDWYYYKLPNTRPPDDPDFPNPYVFIWFGVGFGLALGISFALYLALRNSRWQRSWEGPLNDAMWSSPVLQALEANSITLSPECEPAKPAGLTYVSFWPRAGARLIDVVVHTLVSGQATVFLITLLAAASGGDISSGVWIKLRHLGFVEAYAISLFGVLAYHWVSVSVHGSTLGKHLLSMVVIQEDGTPCRGRSAIKREVGFLLDNLLPGIPGYFIIKESLKKQRWGDEWAHTVVCKRSSVAPERLRSEARFALGMTLALMADTAVRFVGLLLHIHS
jgi:uncharacterized RDD family membrane protein YckC